MAVGGQAEGIQLRGWCGCGVRLAVGDPHFSPKQGGSRCLCTVPGTGLLRGSLDLGSHSCRGAGEPQEIKRQRGAWVFL